MLYKNLEIFNIEDLIENDDGSVSWLRVPKNVYDTLDSDFGRQQIDDATGVELRFKMNGDKVTLRMAVKSGTGRFHVFRGNVQGGWQDHEVDKVVTTEPHDFVIEASQKPEYLRAIAEKIGSEWDCDIVRVIFDIGHFKLFDVIGDIEPPKSEQTPARTLMCYGSSITHGSNSIDMSHSWASLVARELRYDVKNKGMSGSCCMEPAYIDYIAAEGKANRWDALIMELGINVLHWDEAKIYERATYAIQKTASENPDKPILILSPFYHCGDDFAEFDGNGMTRVWRKALREIVEKFAFPNVTYVDGTEILNGMEFMSADFVHPNIYGVAQIAERVGAKMRSIVQAYYG